MSPQHIREMLLRQPFIPFRIHVSDRSHYDITRPALVWVGNRETRIGITRDSNSDFWDEPVFVSNIHITRLEPIVPENQQTNTP